MKFGSSDTPGNLTYPKDFSSRAISEILDHAATDVVFLADPRIQIEPEPALFERLRLAVRGSEAGLVYCDSVGHPRIDYQRGSIRDNFDFGPVLAVSAPAARQVWEGGESRWAGLYDLRLRLSEA